MYTIHMYGCINFVTCIMCFFFILVKSIIQEYCISYSQSIESATAFCCLLHLTERHESSSTWTDNNIPLKKLASIVHRNKPLQRWHQAERFPCWNIKNALVSGLFISREMLPPVLYFLIQHHRYFQLRSIQIHAYFTYIYTLHGFQFFSLQTSCFSST